MLKINSNKDQCQVGSQSSTINLKPNHNTKILNRNDNGNRVYNQNNSIMYNINNEFLILQYFYAV